MTGVGIDIISFDIVGNGVICKKVKSLSKTKNIEKLSKSKKSDFTKAKSNGIFATDFLISKAKIVFISLKKFFTKAPILCHFNPKYHNLIETDVLGYEIGKIFS